MQATIYSPTGRSSSPGCHSYSKSPSSQRQYVPVDKVTEGLFKALGESILSAQDDCPDAIIVEYYAPDESHSLTEVRKVIRISRAAPFLACDQSKFDEAKKESYLQTLVRLVGECEKDRLVSAVLTQCEGILDLNESKILQSWVIQRL